jgi:ATP-dependent exoDNAse (exonuclease V) beta subunit
MVVTFINKAAGELKARLLAALAEATHLAQERLNAQGLQVSAALCVW